MAKLVALQHHYVEFIPTTIEPGILYISKKYRTASHLCACGCEMKVVTPLNPAKWKLTDHGGSVSLYPSVGNWGFSCRSHYWIDHGMIGWAESMSDKKIAHVKDQDQRAVQQLAGKAKRQNAASDTTPTPPTGSSLLDRLIRWMFGGK